MSDILKNLFEKTFNEQVIDCLPIKADGSNRKYFRLNSKNNSAVGVVGTSVEENRAFEEIAKHLSFKGFNVPKFFTATDNGLCYLQEDLGDVSLFEYISNGRKTGIFSQKEKDILYATIAQLPDIQFLGAQDFNFSVCCPLSEFNRRAIMWDLNYFKYCFLKLQQIEFQENKLENDFENFASQLLNVPLGDRFMYRDFQSRNVIIKGDKPYFIDFQGARRGAVYYDLAAFLWQASANFPETLKNDLTEIYLQNLRKYTDFSEQEFCKNLNIFALFRTLQVLGAYGFRGLIEKKPHFIDSIFPAIKNLREILKDITNNNFPYLIKILSQLTELEQFKPKEKRDKLLVRIFSFSYKKGVPVDVSGNGGGFVFDCRAINNPGKYLEYKNLTGLDESVKEFFLSNSEIHNFLNNCYLLIDQSVAKYQERGFTDLYIAFGCTGGQHRSVFCAQKTAEHLYKNFDVEVKVFHRELDIF
ncbi:MAG: phosphotransferase [Paludibacter sp.]|nr:phosphotransferase [Paludibacter sp.]